MNTKIFFRPLCLVLLLTAATGAIADPRPDRVERAEMKVSLAGIALDTLAGVREAHLRLAEAARRLCAKFSDSRRVADQETYRDCYRDTLASSVSALDARLAEADKNRADSASDYRVAAVP